jgi:hypothetical protein
VESYQRGSDACHLPRAPPVRQEENAPRRIVRAAAAAIFFQVTGAHGDSPGALLRPVELLSHDQTRHGRCHVKLDRQT